MYIHIKMTNNEHKNLNDRILALGMYPGLKCQPSCGGGAVIYCINSWGASSKIKKKRSWSERWDSDLQGVIEVHGNYLYTGGGAKCSKLIYGTYIEVEKKKHHSIYRFPFCIFTVLLFMHYKTSKLYRYVSDFIVI